MLIQNHSLKNPIYLKLATYINFTLPYLSMISKITNYQYHLRTILIIIMCIAKAPYKPISYTEPSQERNFLLCCRIIISHQFGILLEKHYSLIQIEIHLKSNWKLICSTITKTKLYHAIIRCVLIVSSNWPLSEHMCMYIFTII